MNDLNADALRRDPPSTLMHLLGDGRLVSFDAAASRATLEFTAHAGMCHSGGVVQGGFVTGWMDSAMAHAVIMASEGAASPASLEIKINFLRAANPGPVRAEGWVVRLGRSIAFLEGRITTAGGEVIATGSSTAKMVAAKGR